MLPALILASFAEQGQAKTVEMHPVASTPAPVPVPAPARSTMREDGWRSELDLRHWPTATFHQDLTDTIEALSEAQGAELSGVMLNAVELYLTHMMLFEASSALEGFTPVTEDQQRRYRALSDAVALLQGAPVTDFGQSPLNVTTRPDRAFWVGLQAIASDDVTLLNAQIQASFNGLGLQSRAVLRQMLPVFTEAAIELGYEKYADAALRLMRELPDISESPTGLFLSGRAQERRGNESSALEAYFLAAKGWDQYAARARLAVADMSLRDGSRGALLAAQSTLTEGAEAWRGNRYELEVLKRLVRIYEAIDNDVEGLLTLGKILARFPATAEAATSRMQAEALLAEVYRKGGEGQYPLASWMDVHLRLLPFFRSYPSFVSHTEIFGDYVLGLGATDLAVKEYRRAIQLILTRTGLLAESERQDLTRLNLKLADAQWRAGLIVEARATLDQMVKPQNREDREAYSTAMARVLSDLNDRPALLQTVVTAPNADHLRDVGQALTADGKWAGSASAFLRLWDRYPQDFSLEDATHLLIAANRSDDTLTMGRVARAFPELTKSKALIELAKSLNVDTPSLLPLRAEMAVERLQRLDEAFQTIKNASTSE